MSQRDGTVTDMFCGAGGSTQGATWAGFEVRLAINHWERAVATHNTNFPGTKHDCADISAVDPRRYFPTDVLIASPECTNHTGAKGKKRKNLAQLDMFAPQEINPDEERSRATMWDVPRFAEYHDYRVVVVENVVEARWWALWDAWIHAMKLLGYDHEIVYFNSQFAPPTPQSRDRMYVVFTKKGHPKPNLKFTPPAWCAPCGKDVAAVQAWKNPANPWGRYGRQYVYLCPECNGEVRPYYYAAATAIDWSIVAPRIGDRTKPLKDKTLKRIELGLRTIGQQQPMIMNTAYSHAVNNRCWPVDKPMFTLTASPSTGVLVPPGAFILDQLFEYRARSLEEPLSTIVAQGNHQGVVIPPAPKVTNPFLLSYYGNGDSIHSVNEPMGTLSTHDRHGLAVPGQEVSAEDCGFRMLSPDEIKAAMAFPRDYVILGTNRERVKQAGNAVTPPVMEQLMSRVSATFN